MVIIAIFFKELPVREGDCLLICFILPAAS
jgi:hypothetical protein